MISEYLAIFIGVFTDLLTFAIIARVLLSWFPNSGAENIKMMLNDITEPFLSIFRKIVPRIGMIDITPIVAILALDLLKYILISLVLNLPF
jgi:YggT family protein